MRHEYGVFEYQTRHHENVNYNYERSNKKLSIFSSNKFVLFSFSFLGTWKRILDY